jgi:hypothetical protein
VLQLEDGALLAPPDVFGPGSITHGFLPNSMPNSPVRHTRSQSGQ